MNISLHLSPSFSVFLFLSHSLTSLCYVLLSLCLSYFLSLSLSHSLTLPLSLSLSLSSNCYNRPSYSHLRSLFPQFLSFHYFHPILSIIIQLLIFFHHCQFFAFHFNFLTFLMTFIYDSFYRATAVTASPQSSV